MFVKIDCLVCLIYITCTFFRNNGGKAMEFCCLVFLTWQLLGPCQRTEIRTVVWLQGLRGRREKRVGKWGKFCSAASDACANISLMWASWFLQCLRPLCLPKLLRLSSAHPAQQNLTHCPALVQHPAAGTISLLQWVQLCSFALVWRFLFQHWGFKAGILVLAVWLTEFNQRALHKSSSKGLVAFVTVPLCQGASKALIQSKDFRPSTLKPVIPNWLPQLFRCFSCDLKVPTATGAVPRLGPTKGTAVSELRVNKGQWKRLLKTALSLFSFTHLLKQLR